MYQNLNYSTKSWGRFYWHCLTLFPAWISNYNPSKMWNEITYPFLYIKCCTPLTRVWEWICDFILDNECNYLSMLEFKLIHVSKMDPSNQELEPDRKFTREPPYLNFTGELWAVCYKFVWEKWPRCIERMDCNMFVSSGTPLTDIHKWISNCIHDFIWDTILTNGLISPPLTFENWWVIISHCFTSMQLLIRVPTAMLV